MNKYFYKKILQKNRLNQYINILTIAIENGYILTSLSNWYENYRNSNKKVLILRHDVDYDTQGALKFYLIEKKLGVNSTFYFRWATMNSSIMKQMHNSGFEVSLHYETLANYAKNNNIYNPEIITKEIINICFNKLLTEIEIFEKKYWKINTICSHGDKRNRILKTPNHKIINMLKLHDWGINFNVYNPEILKQFDSYISDSSIYSNFDWKRNGSPIKAIKKENKIICLLTHPIHWNQSFFKNIKMLITVFKDNQ